MAATEADSVNEHMARLRVRMVQQKLANEKEKLMQRPQSEASNKDELEQQARLQQAMLRRQELLDRIKREQLINEENRRPRTYSPRRRYTPSPLPIPPTRRSLPAEFFRYNYPDTFRSKAPDVSPVKHVIEHVIAPPPNQQYNLPQIEQPPKQSVIVAPPPPPVHIMQQQQPPQIISAPAAPQIIAANPPNPVITHLNPPQPENRSMFNKGDFMEMMMMQNAQMHHMVMQQMMVNTLPGNRSSLPPVSNDTQLVAVQVPRTTGAVHHHHYSAPPQPEPQVHTYTTMPALELRGGFGGYPMRDYASYSYPDYYSYPYDDGYPYYYPRTRRRRSRDRDRERESD